MRTTISVISIAFATQVSALDSCPDMGLSNDYIAQQFCAQLQSLSDKDVTRSMDRDETVTVPNLAPQWSEIGVIQDAYRADPQKTLALIARIRKAGGLNE